MDVTCYLFFLFLFYTCYFGVFLLCSIYVPWNFMESGVNENPCSSPDCWKKVASYSDETNCLMDQNFKLKLVDYGMG